MIRKIFSVMLILALVFGFSAGASSFDDIGETVINYVTQSLETEGIASRFTKRDPSLDLELAQVLEYDYYSCFNEEEDTFLVVQGHDYAMETFEAVTANAALYEEMVLASLYVVQGVYGVCPDEVIEWAFSTAPAITQSAQTELAYLYPLDGDAFFFMHRMPGASASDPIFYYASVYFPCQEYCPLTEIITYMKGIAQAADSPSSSDCAVCEGTGVVISQFEECTRCHGAKRIGTCTLCRGKTVCKICEGKGYVEMYNYVQDYPYHKNCTACDMSGICAGCDGTGLAVCTRCSGMGYKSTTSKCTACGGDGRV